jgi:hypothetical protein
VRALAALAALLMARDAAAQPGRRTPVWATPHFAFFSDFETNLNDALIEAGLAGKAKRPVLFEAGSEAACFAALPAEVRAAWLRALDYYAEIVSPGGFGRRPQYVIRVALAGLDEEVETDADRQLVAIAAAFRSAAAPTYRACRWPAQDEKNRQWIAAVMPGLSAHEATIAPRLERLYGKTFGREPIAVDIVEAVDWSGANTFVREPAGGHLLIASSNPLASGLEIVFHEASHTFMRPADPVRQALAEAARAAQWRLPAELWHVVLFYTTGAVVRDVLAAAGQRGYATMLEEIQAKGTWGQYRHALERAWRPYVEGQRTLQDAARALVRALREAQPASPSP